MSFTSIFVVFVCILDSIVYAVANNSPLDCGDIDIKRGSGVYKIYPEGSGHGGFNVYCDMDSENENVDGGWTVFQRRLNGEEYFPEAGEIIKQGSELFRVNIGLVGNAKLHILTSQANNEILIKMKTFENENGYARYSDFKVDDEVSKFTMTLSTSTFTGNVGDSLSRHNGMKFSTKDQDNDIEEGNSCALSYKGGCWYERCHSSNLNGNHHAGNHTSYADGVNWRAWKGYHYSLKETTMMIRQLQ